MIVAQKKLRVFAASLVLALSIGPAIAADGCPLDRVIFKDTKTGREFVAERVAIKFQYLCGDTISKEFGRPQTVSKDCRGPFGDTIIEGSLQGNKAFAVYSVGNSLPCCVWYSYPGTDRSSATLVKHWLAHDEVPRITLGDEEYTIGPPNPPFDPDRGPMGDGEFVPTTCRPN